MELPVLTADLAGKTIIVTGSNTGIGLETAKHFARMNPAKLICTCRSEEKCQETVKVIEAETGFKDVEGWELELSSFASVVSFAEKFKKEGRSLDILVANAGVAMPDFQQTQDGWETSLQVNHLSTALLAILLLPQFENAATSSGTASRLVIVSSRIHVWADFSPTKGFSQHILENLNDKQFTTQGFVEQRYSQTKLLNVLFTRALNVLLPPTTPVVVCTVDPSFCISDLRRHIDHGQYNELLKKARTAEEGSRQLIWGALAPQPYAVEGEERYRGAYITDNAVSPPSPWVLSEEGKVMQDRAWNETIHLLSSVSPEVKSITEAYRSAVDART